MTHIGAGQIAPSFSLTTPDGKVLSLADALEGHPAVLAFFKVTCPVCQFTFPFLERLHRIHGQNAFVLAISQDDPRDTRDFMNEYKLTFPAVVDGEGFPVSSAYGLTNVPTIFLIDSDGRVVVSSVGFVRADLENIFERLGKRSQLPPAALFHLDEVIPSYKPG